MGDKLQDHELKVEHKNGKVMVISKKLFHESPDDWKLLEGEPGEAPEQSQFVQAEKPKDKQAEGGTVNKEDVPPAKAKKIAPPKI